MKQPQHASLLLVATVLLSAADALSTLTRVRPYSATPHVTPEAISILALQQRTQLQHQMSLDVWLSKIDEEDYDKESAFEHLHHFKATGTRVGQETLQTQTDPVAETPNLLLDRKDASDRETFAMSSTVEQLPKKAVEARSMDKNKKVRNNDIDFAKTRVTVEQEIELGRIIQKGVVLQRLRQELTTKLGREPTKQEWAAAAELSPKDVRRQISDYRKAKQELVTANLGLVHAVVKKMFQNRKQPVSTDELVQEGSLGLLRAAELFDPSKGVRFSTYAFIWIKGTLQKSHLPEMIKLPLRDKMYRDRISRARRLIEDETGKPASLEQLSEATGLKVEQIVTIQHKMSRAQGILGLDHTYVGKTASGTPGSETTMLDFVSDKNDVAKLTQLRADLSATMAKALDDREARLMRLRFGLTDGRARTWQECADLMGLSHARVHQLSQRCLKKLRQAAEADALGEYCLTIA